MNGVSWVQVDWVRNICGYKTTGKQERLLPLFFNLTRWRCCFVFVMVRQFYLLNSTDNVLEKYQTVNQEHFQNEIISELLLELDFLPLNDLTVKMALGIMFLIDFTASSVQSPMMLSFAFENLGRQLR